MRSGRLFPALGAALLWLTWLSCPARLSADDGLAVAPALGYAGTTVDLSGCGFQPGEVVGVTLDGDAAGQDTTDKAGCAHVSRATAPSIAPTVHLWSINGQRSAAALQAVYVFDPGSATAVPASLPAAGGTFRLQGVNFAPGEPVDLIPTEGHLLSPGTVLAGPDGAFASGLFTLLPGAPPGPNVVMLRGRRSSLASTAAVLVQEPPIPVVDDGWVLDGLGTVDDPRAGTRTTVALQLWLTIAGGKVSGAGQYVGEVTTLDLACGGDPIPIGVAGSLAGNRLSLASGVAAPGAEAAIRCAGLPATSFPLPGGPGIGPPIAIDLFDGATADLDSPSTSGPTVHWHYALRAVRP